MNNRELKFRQPIFGGNDLSFRSWHYWGFVDDDKFYGVVAPFDIAKETSQQFTGLLDKNGKEIYEGDINKTHEVLKYGSYKVEDTRLSYNSSNIQYDMYYGWYWEDTRGEQEHFWDCSQIEIIGNIHENPELKGLM